MGVKGGEGQHSEHQCDLPDICLIIVRNSLWEWVDQDEWVWLVLSAPLNVQGLELRGKRERHGD